MASQYLRKFNKNYLILRSYQIYGPFQKDDRLIPFIIKSCIKNKLFPCSEGSQLRDFLYIDDFTNLIIKIIKRKNIYMEILTLDLEDQLKLKMVQV